MNLQKNKTDKMHTEELGFTVPDDYFETSKNEILKKISTKKEPKLKLFNTKKVVWLAAASIALLIAFTVFKPNSFTIIDKIPTIVSDSLNKINDHNIIDDYFASEDNIILTSLFIDEANIDSYVANYIVEDILIDEYLDDYILDEIMDDELILN